MGKQYIEALKSRNVHFMVFSEYDAMQIMHYKFSYYTLIDYYPVFETYHARKKSGLFIDLDFAQLYYLANIDLQLRKMVMATCLDVEACLKSRLVFEIDSCCGGEFFFSQYYAKDRDYLDKVFSPEATDNMKNGRIKPIIEQISFYEFIKNAQFGTLERIAHAFYKDYAVVLYGSKYAPFEVHLSGIRKLRNIVAHNNSLLGSINQCQGWNDVKLLAILGKEGIGHRSLKRNMSRAVICNVCELLYEYNTLCGNAVSLKKSIEEFDKLYCRPYHDFFSKVDALSSTYSFMKKAVPILLNEDLTNRLNRI